jgi:hypothetical protein
LAKKPFLFVLLIDKKIKLDILLFRHHGRLHREASDPDLLFVPTEFDVSKSRHHQHLIPKGSLGATKKPLNHPQIKGWNNRDRKMART